MITVAIPFYNADKFLGFAIQSVIKQTYKNWKLILIDDGSVDKSLNIGYNGLICASDIGLCGFFVKFGAK